MLKIQENRVKKYKNFMLKKFSVKKVLTNRVKNISVKKFKKYVKRISDKKYKNLC